MNLRKEGFSQRRPKEPGVYFIGTDGHLAQARRLREGWDVAHIIFYAGSFDNAFENRESAAYWMIQTLDGVCYGWEKGMWIKGPIDPTWEPKPAKVATSC